MTDDMTIGQRVAFYRTRRGMSQEVLAGLVGKTEEWLRKIENDRAPLDRLSVIRSLARTLDVTLADLIGEPSLFEWSGDSGSRTIPALRSALHDYRHLTHRFGSVLDDDPPRLDDLGREVAGVWETYQVSNYGALARRLPLLIQDCLAATRTHDGGDGQRAQALAAYVHQVATLFLTKLGEVDLAWISAGRALAAANESNDHIVLGSVSRTAAHALVSIGEYAQALTLAAGAVDSLGPRMRLQPGPDLVAVAGSLHLICAVAAARDDDRRLADDHLRRASECADKLGVDGNHVWTAFGPTNVAIHRVTVAMELGDVQRAIKIGPSLDTSALPVERRVRHAIETARALARRNMVDEALHQLLTAEQIGAEQVRYHRLSRTIVREFLVRPRPPRLAIELSERMGIGTRTPRW